MIGSNAMMGKRFSKKIIELPGTLTLSNVRCTITCRFLIEPIIVFNAALPSMKLDVSVPPTAPPVIDPTETTMTAV